MYILLEKNARGNLEVDDQIIDKTIEFNLLNNTNGVDKFEIETDLHQDEQLFVIIKIYASGREKLEIDEMQLNNSLVFAIENAIGFKPKSIAFVYIKN